MIVRFSFPLPLNYLFQVNTFLCSALRMNCCARVVKGSGPDGPVPFGIYVDSGVVVLCIMALRPVCPLIAPVLLIYFLVFEPMSRWNLIFYYRPSHDCGGKRWPLILDIKHFGWMIIKGRASEAQRMVVRLPQG